MLKVMCLLLAEMTHVLASLTGCGHQQLVISCGRSFEHSFLTNSCIFMLLVMTMESQAEALGQLGADDLEGKVKSDTAYILLMIYLLLVRSDHYYLFVGSLQCLRLHRLMTILHN
jgi:hypothetical protein